MWTQATGRSRFVAGFLNLRSITFRSFANPKILRELSNYNRMDILRLELPASNGTGEVRAVAWAYGAMATRGAELGITPATMEELVQPARPPSGGLRDLVIGVDTIFSLGLRQAVPQVPLRRWRRSRLRYVRCRRLLRLR